MVIPTGRRSPASPGGSQSFSRSAADGRHDPGPAEFSAIFDATPASRPPSSRRDTEVVLDVRTLTLTMDAAVR